MKVSLLIYIAILIATSMPVVAFSVEEAKTAREAGLMQGFPPAKDKAVDISNWL